MSWQSRPSWWWAERSRSRSGRSRRASRASSYPVTGAVAGLAFDVGDGDIVIVGGGRRDAVEVQRTERYSFGHGPEVERRVDGATFGVRARCPATLLGPCTVAYRVIVPDNVALDIRTSGGNVTLRGYRGSARVTTGGGAIDISGYCGNSLDARAGGGDITSRPRARRRGCRCARARARSTPCSRPAATTSTPRARPATRACAA